MQVARLEPGDIERVNDDRVGARDRRLVELASVDVIRADRVDVRPSPKPGTVEQGFGRSRRRDDDIGGTYGGLRSARFDGDRDALLYPVDETFDPCLRRSARALAS